MRIMFFLRVTTFCVLSAICNLSQATASHRPFQSYAQEMQYQALIEEFRCPKCQNANLAGSDAPIAQDLKHKTYLLVQQGQSDDQIRQYMTSRYGEFISYKPPVNRSTWILWFAPPLVLVLVLFVWIVRSRLRENVKVIPLSAEESWRLNQILNKNNFNDQDIRHDR